ncbi:MAG: hypothetical protein EOO63_08245 [Hymenobacter sp.]|nr:MAG: hypothetical protein EOO63_08245 [Hymenobacter sp.]
MKLFLPLLFVLTAGAECAAQQVPLAAANPSVVLPDIMMAKRPVTDSVRQAVHQLFKRGRLFSAVGGVSGALVVGSGVTYAVRDGLVWQPITDVLLGGTAVAGGLIGRARYSRRQEKQALAALEQGYGLPPYVAELVPLLPKKNRQLVLSALYQ